MDELTALAEKYGTDKAGVYTGFYNSLFESRRGDEYTFDKVLEIGIGTKESMVHVPDYKPGASLRMWRDYFQMAEIYGVDCDPSASVSEDRIHSIIADSRNTLEIARLSGIKSGHLFDLIVDDGDHDVKVQCETFKNLFPLLRADGFYIIEDAEQWSELSNFLQPLPHQIVFSQYLGLVGKLILIRKECRP